VSPLFHNFIPARGRCKVTQQPEEVAYIPKPTVSLDVVSLVANSYGYYSLKSSNALRSNSRCTWRHSEGSRNVHNTVIRRALSPLHSCGSVTADVHG